MEDELRASAKDGRKDEFNIQLRASSYELRTASQNELPFPVELNQPCSPGRIRPGGFQIMHLTSNRHASRSLRVANECVRPTEFVLAWVSASTNSLSPRTGTAVDH